MKIRIAAFGLIALLFIPLAGHAGKKDKPGEHGANMGGSGMATIYLFRPSRFIGRLATPMLSITGPSFRCSVYLKNKRYVQFQVPPSHIPGYLIDAPYTSMWQIRSNGGFRISISRAGETYYIGLLPFGSGYTMTRVSPSEGKKYLKKLKLVGKKHNTCK